MALYGGAQDRVAEETPHRRRQRRDVVGRHQLGDAARRDLGLERAARFRWEETARATRACYLALATGRAA